MERSSSPLLVLLLAALQGSFAIDLEFISKEPGPGFPLSECQGDCDNDDECAGNLRCFQRIDATPIPGCDNDTPAIFGDDFCYNGPSFIKWRGNNGNGPFPLGECEGDCDNDSECENGLICFHRGTADVPGCLGTPGRSDYCVVPVPGLLTQRTPKNWVTNTPLLNECEGDCNNDSHCAGTLRCFQRNAFEPVPGCDGLGNEKTDYCFQAPSNYLNRIGNNIFGPENPLNLCEGDCDDDDDCAGDLVCHQRDGLDPVPGCIGTPNFNTDYCIDDNATPAPSDSPSAMPSAPPTVSAMPTREKVYEYTGTNTAKDGQVNEDDRPCGDVNGPAPNADGSDLVMRFFVIGDTPYDKSDNSCLNVQTNVVEEECVAYDCDGVPVNGNTCLWIGGDYECLQDTLIPYMKTQNDKVAFAAHIGDFLGGMGLMNTRCNFASFDSRKNLFAGFQPDMDFLIVPGDNEWNECIGFDENSNDDAIKTLWRERFADSNSPFYSFTRDFPGTPINGYPVRPTLERQEDANDVSKHNPENFFFKHNDVAFFGLNDLNTQRGAAWVGQNAQNAAWVTDKLGSDCSFESIVIFTQSFIRTAVRDALDDYFVQCGGDKPVLNLTGDKHPQVYCGNQNGKIMKITVEAFKAAPLLVSIIADPVDGKHYFHAEPTSPGTPYGVCGDTFLQVPN